MARGRTNGHRMRNHYKRNCLGVYGVIMGNGYYRFLHGINIVISDMNQKIRRNDPDQIISGVDFERNVRVVIPLVKP